MNTPIVIVDNYDSFTYNLYQMLQAQTNSPVLVHRNDALTLQALWALNPAAIVLSPGPGHPAIAADFGICADILKHYQNSAAQEPSIMHDKPLVPLLGVCLGHQGMGLVFGGQVVQAPTIVHGKSSPVVITAANPLLEGLSNPFEAMRYHSLVVANNEHFPHEHFDISAITHLAEDEPPLIMAMHHKTLPLYGVQFHPESIGTPQGERLLGNFLHLAGVLKPSQ
ncbi:MAG: aminodeoxychorismate/anthranilate synthase component II [Vampirovibrionales bacterium]|nr:aminodeoxychorismate/anthranilate synthase component II [Vampirovibrionales bacterium]